jgi:hypothetical protein
MRHATENDLKEIYAVFQKHRDVFPHIRQDALKRRIEAHECINQDGVIITFQKYKKRTKVGDVQVPAGAIMVHQILNTNQFNGAGGRVFEQFVEEIVKPSGGDLFLSVRKENTVACQFYERNGMVLVGTVSWSAGTISGLMYSLSPNGESNGAGGPHDGLRDAWGGLRPLPLGWQRRRPISLNCLFAEY